MASKTLVAFVALFLFLLQTVFTQSSNIETGALAVPFLRLNVDARSSGMGDAGIALVNDANAIFINASKNIFNDDSTGIAINYKSTTAENSWQLEDKKASLFSASGYYKLDDKNLISAGFRYFDMGTVILSATTQAGYDPNEYAIDLNYSRKFGENFAAGLTAKYVYSNLATGQSVNGVEIKPSNGIVADISAFYTNDFKTGNKISYISAGINISNLGDKITYSSSIEKDFLPSNLGAGVAYGIELNNYHSFTIEVDVNKFLVPTTDTTDKEEMHEITFSSGFEYAFDDQFFVRGGYFFEHLTKGGRQYYTTGAGVNYWKLQFDLAYLIPAGNPQNPLEASWTFTLSAWI